jgi:hypothetical protein
MCRAAGPPTGRRSFSGPCSGTPNEQWHRNGSRITGIGGKCLNVQGRNAADGTPIILWPCSGTENERWFFRGNHIVGLGGKCLNVQGGGDADGTPIILWPCSGTPNEVWHVRR